DFALHPAHHEQAGIADRFAVTIADQRRHQAVALLDQPLLDAQDARRVVDDRLAALLAAGDVGVHESVHAGERLKHVERRNAYPASKAVLTSAVPDVRLQLLDPGLGNRDIEHQP